MECFDELVRKKFKTIIKYYDNYNVGREYFQQQEDTIEMLKSKYIRVNNLIYFIKDANIAGTKSYDEDLNKIIPSLIIELYVALISDEPEFNGNYGKIYLSFPIMSNPFIFSDSLESIKLYDEVDNEEPNIFIELKSIESSFGKLKGVFIDVNQNKHLVFEKERIPAYYFYKMLRSRNFNRLEHFMSLLGGMLLNNMKYNRLDFDLIMRVRDLKLFKTEDEL